MKVAETVADTVSKTILSKAHAWIKYIEAKTKPDLHCTNLLK